MNKNQEHVLVAALCWGLGHATRCIPIIRELQLLGYVPVIASDGVALDLLRKEFPDAIAVELPAYNILYKLKHMFWNMAIQDHKILRAAFLEHRAVQKLVQQYAIKVIISDNRYGCFHREAHNIFITHQLEIQIRPKFFQRLSNFLQRYALKNFDEIWIPDLAENPGLAGQLSHLDVAVHPNLRYVGPLSRMQKMQLDRSDQILVILSGPEPQRTIFEEIVLKAAMQSDLNWLIIRGIVHGMPPQVNNPKVKIINYLTAEALNLELLQCAFLISRSGYSTIMDLAVTGAKAVLVPTPGQTEQEYLARLYAQGGIFMQMQQDAFRLQDIVENIHQYSGIQHSPESLLKAAVATIGR